MALVTNQERADAAFAVEQGLRAIERLKRALCPEHGCAIGRCAGQYHAAGRTRHGVLVHAMGRARP